MGLYPYSHSSHPTRGCIPSGDGLGDPQQLAGPQFSGRLFQAENGGSWRQRGIGNSLPNNRRQHRTLHIQKNVLPNQFLLVTVPSVSRSCEHFSDGFDLHLLHPASE